MMDRSNYAYCTFPFCIQTVFVRVCVIYSLPSLVCKSSYYQDSLTHTCIRRFRNCNWHWTAEQRKEASERDDVADLRTADFGMTAPGGHPSELHVPRPGAESAGRGHVGAASQGPPSGVGLLHGPPGHGHQLGSRPPSATTPVAARIADGADYIKIMIEEGSVLKSPGLPLMSTETVITASKRRIAMGRSQ